MLGQKLADRYEIVSELGRGGMGVVYRARDPRLNRDVAVKLIPPSQLSADAEQRFQREAQLVAQMDHPSIVPIYDFGRHEDALYFVMALVQGTNLRAFLRQGSQLGDIVDIGIQVAEALDYSHARGVVHRDIKPENIMVAREEGRGVRVRVMDFGLARATSETRMTRTGTLMGTLGYLSPEQIVGKDLDGRSDIYALGTVLYECVVGEPPFSGEPQAVVYRIVHEFAQGPRQRGAAIDEALEAIILGCLPKEPARRPQRAADLAEALTRYRAGLRDSDRDRSLADLTRSVPLQRPNLAPFIGRHKESAELQLRLNAAVAGECQFVLVGGEPGVGKTRLLDELENLAKARQISVLHGRSVEQDRSFPYQGFCDLIQDYFRRSDGGSSAPPDLSDLAGDLVALFPMLNEVREIRSAASGSITTVPGPSGADRTQIFELLSRTLTRLAGGRPVAFFLEDLHEAEISIEALQYVVRRLGPTPTLVVGTYRSTEIDGRHPLTRLLQGFRGDRRFALIALGPFTPSDHRSFLETLVGSGVSDSLAQRLFDGSEGNPFFTKELVRSLTDSNGMSRDDSGVWTLSAGASLTADVLPATIQEAVEKRIERLPDDLRDVLSTAAVLGRSFDARDLEALVKGIDVDDAIDRLVEQGLIEEERDSRGGLLSFSSGVVRDVLYAGLSPRKRRTLHRRCAELLESRHVGRLERVLPHLVDHCFQGDMPEKTVEYALRLAQASLDAFSPDEATRAAKAALTFLDEEWAGDRLLEGEARLQLARALRMAGDVEGALRESAAAARVYEQQGQAARGVGALVLAAEAAWQARRTDEASRWIEKGLAGTRAAGDAAGLHRLLSLGATVAGLLGEQERATAYLHEAARLEGTPKEGSAHEDVPRGGLLAVALANPMKAAEPIDIQTVEDIEVLANVYETLLATDTQGHVVPALCTTWEMLDGGRRFRLRCAPDVRFQDDRPLHAADVKASIERAIAKAGRDLPAAYSLIDGVADLVDGPGAGLDAIRVTADDEIEIRLRDAVPIFPALLTHRRTAIARPAASPDARPQSVGTGPFRIVSIAPDRVVLGRHAGYWGGAPANLDAIEFRLSMTAAAIAKDFRAGEIDLARDLLPMDLDEVVRDPATRRRLVESPKRNTYFIVFNCMTGLVSRHEAVRRALGGVVQARDLVWRTLGRFAEPATGLIPPGMFGHDPGRRERGLTREQAVELMRAAPAEVPLLLRAAVHPVIQDQYSSLLASLVARWAELGVEVRVGTSTMAEFLEAWKQGEGFDLLIGRWNADYDDPDDFTYTLFHSRLGDLRTYFSSGDADRLLEDARSETRPAVREAHYRKLEHLLFETGAVVPLFHDIDYRVATAKVRGLKLRSTPPYVNYAELGKAESAVPVVEPGHAGGGIVHVPVVGALRSLDPAPFDTIEKEAVANVFETLTHVAEGARIVPWLAASFSAEEGGRRYRFRLRDDVRFHDGRRLTARDVRYSFERLLQTSDSESRWFYAAIHGARPMLEGNAGDLVGFRIQSATEFTIDLEEPTAIFPALVSHGAASIVPEGSDPAAEAAVGTGPFRVKAFDPGRRLELERHAGYWRSGYPRNDGLVFTFGVTPAETLAGFRAGRFSLAADLLPADVEALRREPAFASGYKETPRLITYYVGFNTHHGPLADRRLRERIVQTLDVPRLVRQAIGRLAIPATSLIPPGLLGRDPMSVSRLERTPSARPDRLPEPIDLTAAVNPIFFAGYATLAREVTQALGQTGVRIRIGNKTIAELTDAQSHGKVDVVLARWVADYPDPDTFANLLHSKHGLYGRMGGTPELDRIIERARAETASATRHALYRQLEDTISRDALLLPLFHEQGYRFARPEVEGLSVNFMQPTVAFEELRIRSEGGGR